VTDVELWSRVNGRSHPRDGEARPVGGLETLKPAAEIADLVVRIRIRCPADNRM
jgi:hypothetical protein